MLQNVSERATPRSAQSCCDISSLQQQYRDSPYASLRRLVCELSNDRVKVRGTVPSYYLKQLAQSLAMKSVALGALESAIDVRPE